MHSAAKGTLLVVAPLTLLFLSALLFRGKPLPLGSEAPTKRPAIAPTGPASDPRRPQKDLLSQVQPGRDAVRGEWTWQGKFLRSPDMDFARLRVPGSLPEEYDLVVVATRWGGGDSLNLGLVAQGKQFVVVMDGWDKGDSTGIDLIEKRPFFYNETTFRGKLLPVGERRIIVCSIRATGLRLTVDQKTVIDWKGRFSGLSLYPEWDVGDPASLFVGSYKSEFQIESIVLFPL